MLMPSSSRIKTSCLSNSGFLTRATQWRAFIFFAIRHERIFTSSELVTAMKILALSTFASSSTSVWRQFPAIPITSRSLTLESMTSSFLSITVTLCSSLRTSARALPTLPQPTIIMSIIPPNFYSRTVPKADTALYYCVEKIFTTL